MKDERFWPLPLAPSPQAGKGSILTAIVFALPLLILTTSFAAPASQPSTGGVDRLVRQLSADDWKARESAEAALVQLGSSAREKLEAALDQPIADETRARIHSALQRIAESDATGPTLITLHVKDAHPRDVFAQLSKQIGYELRPATPQLWDEVAWPRITLDLDRVPFWAAIQQLEAACSAELTWEEDGWKIGAPGSGSLHGVSRVCGPLLIVATRVNRSAAIDLTDAPPTPPPAAANAAPPQRVEPTEKSFDVQLMALAEPKLRILQVDSIAHVLEATDERGHSLVLGNPEGEGYSGAGPGGVFGFGAHLDAPANLGTRITHLKGAVQICLETRSETIDLPMASLANFDRTFGEFRLVFKGLVRGDDHYELPVSVIATAAADPNDANGQREALWTRLQSAFSSADVKLMDAHGNVLAPTGHNFNAENGTMEVSLQFAKVPASALNANAIANGNGNGNAAAPQPVEPARFTMKLPVESRDIAIPFDFTDLPIP